MHEISVDQFHNVCILLFVKFKDVQLWIFQFSHHDHNAFSKFGKTARRYRNVGSGDDAVYVSAVGGKILSMNKEQHRHASSPSLCPECIIDP